MKLRKPVKIDERKFFAIGKYVFLVSAIVMLAALIDGLGTWNGITIIKQAAMIAFNFGLMGYFAYLLDKQREMTTDQDAEKFALQAAAMLEEGQMPKKIAKKYNK